MIDWVFFDLGHTLIDEAPVQQSYLRQTYELLVAHDAMISQEQFDMTITDLVSQRVATTHRQLAESLFEKYARKGAKAEFLNELFLSRWPPQKYVDLYVLHKDVMPTLRQISRSHKCGIIANQSALARRFLDSRAGFSSCFKVIVLSEDVGFAKPDPRIFLAALQKAGADARSSMYVGDRVDFDIAPAKALGMITVRIRRKSIFSQIEPLNEEEKADYEIDRLQRLVSILGINICG